MRNGGQMERMVYSLLTIHYITLPIAYLMLKQVALYPLLPFDFPVSGF